MSILDKAKELFAKGTKPERPKYLRGDPPGPSVKGRTILAQKKAQQQAKQTENPYKSAKKSNVAKGTKYGFEKKKSKVSSGFGKTTGAYKIKKGDTLSGIAKTHGTTVAALMKANKGITDKNKIIAGAGLTIPGMGKATTKKTTTKRVDPTKDPRFQRIFGANKQKSTKKLKPSQILAQKKKDRAKKSNEALKRFFSAPFTTTQRQKERKEALKKKFGRQKNMSTGGMASMDDYMKDLL